MPLGTEVGLASATLLDGDPAPSPQKGAQQPPTFRPMSIVANGRPSQHLLSSCNVQHVALTLCCVHLKRPYGMVYIFMGWRKKAVVSHRNAEPFIG